MKNLAKVVSSPYVTQTVWNGGDSGTAICGDGLELNVGREDGVWSPEHLLLLAAEASLMECVLAAVRDIDLPVIGYISSGHLEVPESPDALPRLTVRPCVVVRSAQDANRAAMVLKDAACESAIGRLLGEQIQISIDIRLE